MRVFFYQLFSPAWFYKHTNYWPIIFFSIAFLCLFIGTIQALWGVPADIQQKDAFRILYIHVPCAFMSLAIYAFMGGLSILLLVWRIKMAGWLLSICAEIGMMMTLLAVYTGSIWGKPMWGAWWVWDARLTSEFILLFIYAGIWILEYSYQSSPRDKMLAVIVLIGLFDLPVIHYSVNWWNTLHQGSTFGLFSSSHMDPLMWPPLPWMFFGLLSYCFAFGITRARAVVLWRERRQHWVAHL